MAGRRRKRDTTETLVACHQRRREWLVSRIASTASPGSRVAVAADYLRGALLRLGRAGALPPADANALARDVQEYLTELADQLFEAAIKQRRSRR